MPAGTNFFNDVGSDKSNQSGALVLAAGTQIWVAYPIGGADPTTEASMRHSSMQLHKNHSLERDLL